MKKCIIITTAVALALSSWLVAAGSITDTYTSGDILTATKMNNIKDAVNDNNSDIARINSPIALGSINSNGTERTATSNVSVSLSSTTYTISITGENYSINNFVTNVTPLSTGVNCRSTSVSGNLLVSCFNSSGTAVTTQFQFASYKIPASITIGPAIPLGPIGPALP